MINAYSLKSGRSSVPVANQLVIEDNNGYEYFKSYDSIICKRTRYDASVPVILDERYWNYSRTTSKYLAQFLNCTNKEVKERVANGTYSLANLNV